MYERFTDRARKVMQLANQEAQRFNHEYIGTEHILLGLVKEGSGVAANVLKNLDVDLRKIRLEVEKIVQSGPDMVTMGKLPQTPAGQEGHRVLDRRGPQPQPQLRRHRTPPARPAARAGRRGRPGADEPGPEAGRSARGSAELAGARHGRRRRRRAAAAASGGANGEPPRAASRKTPALDSFGRDLTELARQGKLDPVIGRENEIERVDPDPLPPHEEQPRAAGRGGRRQDGHRRGLGPAGRRRQRARAARATAGSSCSTWR